MPAPILSSSPVVKVALGRVLPFLCASSFALAQTVQEQPVADPARAGFDVTHYDRQVAAMMANSRSFSHVAPAEKLPEDFSPWWIRGQKGGITENGERTALSVEDLYQRALRHSKQIRVFSDLPLIRETGVEEAKGAFDTNAYLQGKFDHANDPVGNVLTTGGASRFKQDQWSFEAGAKKKLITGTEVTLSQGVGRTENNSIYFMPNPQSTAKLALTVVQPLLKGAGVGYNRSIMQIAGLDSEVAMSEFIRQSESHLLEITRTYWALYAARVMYLQKVKLVDESARVADEIHARQRVDARQTQLFRARSALASRRSDLVRAEAATRNAQGRLRALTSDPELLESPESELIPTDRLVLSPAPLDAQAAAYSALRNRPEITQAFLQLRASTLRENMARNEVMPELNLVLQGALGGLTAGDAGSAYNRQYTEGGPGYGAGLVLSFPLENHIGRAHLKRRKLETRQQVDQIRTTIDTVLLEVKVSAREVATAYRETQAKYEAIRAFTEDLDSLEARRKIQDLRDESQVSSYLDNMLDAQDRQAIAGEEFIRSAANYQIALVNLERAKGTLLAYSDVRVMRGRDEKNLPELWLEKGPGVSPDLADAKETK